jgi:hypothetical protein
MALQTEKKPISEKDIEVETSQVSSDAEQITYSSKMESDIESDQITNSETAAENIVKPEKQLPASITLGQGETLRTVALDLFGSKEFWVYIYQENMHSVINPNVIPVGTKLLLPDVEKYDINANDPHSIAKAGEAYLHIGNFDKALETFTMLKNDYLNSPEGQEADKFIKQAELQKESK